MDFEVGQCIGPPESGRLAALLRTSIPLLAFIHNLSTSGVFVPVAPLHQLERFRDCNRSAVAERNTQPSQIVLLLVLIQLLIAATDSEPVQSAKFMDHLTQIAPINPSPKPDHRLGLRLGRALPPVVSELHRAPLLAHCDPTHLPNGRQRALPLRCR